jgi:hypothetical protein
MVFILLVISCMIDYIDLDTLLNIFRMPCSMPKERVSKYDKGKTPCLLVNIAICVMELRG